MASDEEDDYLTMSILDEPDAQYESSIQRRARKLREAELRSQPKSKSQLERESRQARETALSSSILESNPENKGAKLLAKLGYKGGPLGAGEDANARIEPLNLTMKEDRSGIGHESEAKRKFREEAKALGIETKKRKVDEDDFQDRVRKEREERRKEGQLFAAMRVAERLEDTEHEGDQDLDRKAKQEFGSQTRHRSIKSIPVVWRELVRHRTEQEREKRMKEAVKASLPQSRLPRFEDPDEDEDDKIALGKETERAVWEEEEEEEEEEDHELDEFNALEASERLQKLIEYLRKEHRYCFWCKYQYPDEAMEGCSGLTEDEHG